MKRNTPVASRHQLFWWLLCLSGWWLSATETPATEPATAPSVAPPTAVAKESTDAAPKGPSESEKYLRLRRDDHGRPVAMDVAIVRFEPRRPADNSPVVDLVGAVHVAERAYYDELNKRFRDYDAVLYELVAPEGSRPPRDAAAREANPISALQTGMTRLLNLQFQLDAVDYHRPNMVHADMSPAEFRDSMQKRGESPWAMFFRMFVYSMAKQEAKGGSDTSDMELLGALFDKNRSLALKRVMAKQFEDMGGMLLAVEGPAGSTLISRRNAKALEVLRRELDAGRRRIAIFYGAGHLPDMAKRLQSDFDLRPTGTEWLKAWDMSEPPAKTVPQIGPSRNTSPKRQRG